MAVNFAIPFGPSSRLGHLLTSFWVGDDFGALSVSSTAEAATWEDIGTGSTPGAITASESDPNGAVNITSGAHAGDDGGMQLNGEPIQFDRTRDCVFECRFKVSSITTNTAYVFVGICTTNLDFDSGAGITAAHVGFKLDADASIDFTSSNGTTQTTADTTSDVTAATYVVVSWKYSAQEGKVWYFVDGVKKGSVTTTANNLPASTDYLTLVMVAEHAAGSGATLNADYIVFAQDRD